MITYDVLHSQNHQITELSNVLSYLLKDRSLCDTGTCCELFYRYMEKVTEHMDVVDTNLYGRLLTHADKAANNTAKAFMNGSVEINRIMNQYTRKWCHKKSHELSIGGDYEQFLKETDEMFDMILDRIQKETEKLYPLVREISGNQEHAA